MLDCCTSVPVKWKSYLLLPGLVFFFHCSILMKKNGFVAHSSRNLVGYGTTYSTYRLHTRSSCMKNAQKLCLMQPLCYSWNYSVEDIYSYPVFLLGSITSWMGHWVIKGHHTHQTCKTASYWTVDLITIKHQHAALSADVTIKSLTFFKKCFFIVYIRCLMCICLEVSIPMSIWKYIFKNNKII